MAAGDSMGLNSILPSSPISTTLLDQSKRAIFSGRSPRLSRNSSGLRPAGVTVPLLERVIAADLIIANSPRPLDSDNTE